MNKNMQKTTQFFSTYGEVLLRVFVGVLFIVAGAGKLFGGIAGTTGFFHSLGLPIAGFLAYFIAIIEFVGGIFLVAGFMTRITSALLAIIMIVATFTAHLSQGFTGMRLTLVLFFVLIRYIGITTKCSLDMMVCPANKHSRKKKV